METTKTISDLEERAIKLVRDLFDLSHFPIKIYSDDDLVALDFGIYDKTSNPTDEWYEEKGHFISLTRQNGKIIQVEIIGLKQIP